MVTERLEALLGAVDTGLGLGCEVSVRTNDDDGLVGSFDGPGVARLLDDAGALIEAIQVIATQAARRDTRGIQVIVDAGGYRARHRAALERLAKRAAEEALSSGDEIELDSMSAQDRRIVHMALAEIDGVETRSEGDEPNRRIVVEPVE
jgi:spoIIIJ-associated protein